MRNGSSLQQNKQIGSRNLDPGKDVRTVVISMNPQYKNNDVVVIFLPARSAHFDPTVGSNPYNREESLILLPCRCMSRAFNPISRELVSFTSWKRNTIDRKWL